MALVTFVWQTETDGDSVLKSVKEEDAPAFEQQLRDKGYEDYAIIAGSVLKSFHSQAAHYRSRRK